jgi:peptidoglycan/xylan/chitin deacetylase (PgdA/CDA1 family)
VSGRLSHTALRRGGASFQVASLPGIPVVNLLHSRRVFGFVSRHLVCRVPMREKRIALTFDDGPNPAVTPRLLEFLQAVGVHATFVLVGRNAARYSSVAADVARRGHEIGNHTHDHIPLPILPRAMQVRQIERAAQAIEGATGHQPRLFRPPMGWFNRSVLHVLAERGDVPVLGDVYPQDTTCPGAAVLVERILARVGPGSIVILHDGSVLGAVDRHQAVDALETLVPRLLDDGYTLGTVGELLAAAEPATSPCAPGAGAAAAGTCKVPAATRSVYKPG